MQCANGGPVCSVELRSDDEMSAPRLWPAFVTSGGALWIRLLRLFDCSTFHLRGGPCPNFWLFDLLRRHLGGGTISRLLTVVELVPHPPQRCPFLGYIDIAVQCSQSVHDSSLPT